MTSSDSAVAFRHIACSSHFHSSCLTERASFQRHLIIDVPPGRRLRTDPRLRMLQGRTVGPVERLASREAESFAMFC